MEEILKIIHDHHLENVVDLVPGGHVSLLFTESEVQSAKSDYESAQKEGVDLRAIEWLDSDQVFAVGLSFLVKIRFSSLPSVMEPLTLDSLSRGTIFGLQN